MKAFVFPGQGAQFCSMGKDLYDHYESAREMMEQANEILGFRLTDVMFMGSDEELRRTDVTQPAIFLHSIISAMLMTSHHADMVAGHSLGEFSALVAAGVLDWKDGLLLVSSRAKAMQKACEMQKGTMAAILALDDNKVDEICQNIQDEIVVAANYNCPGQVVISGTEGGVEKACELLKEAGAKRTLKLSVGGAFHSPLMKPAEEELKEAILNTHFSTPQCPVYQNVSAKGERDSEIIKQNLVKQLTSPVRWTQSIRQMIADGATEFYEYGPGDVQKGLIKKIDSSVVIG